jgi:hypothetical protein
VLCNLQFRNKLSFITNINIWHGMVHRVIIILGLSTVPFIPIGTLIIRMLSDYSIRTLNSSFYFNRNLDLKDASIPEHSGVHCRVLVILPPSQIISRFRFFRYIDFAIYLDIRYV